ncbi:MAG: GLPGLI family protein [Weeksellaceae bacterium]|nr:GLPGLI family protein [Weeksellaceae bacterium]
MRYFIFSVFLLILCSLSVQGFGQDLRVIYESNIKRDEVRFSEKGDYELLIANGVSLYSPMSEDVFDDMVFKNQLTKKSDRKSIAQVTVDGSNLGRQIYRDIVFNDYINDTIYYQVLGIGVRAVKEEVFPFKWDIVQAKDTVIMGFNCQQAHTQYRGRTYEAYFTHEIPVNLGPWRFHSLPGLILAVQSTDGYFSVNAIKLETNKLVEALKNPYKENKINILEIEDYKTQVHDHYLQSAKSQAAKNPSGGSYSINFAGDNIEDFGIESIDFDY